MKRRRRQRRRLRTISSNSEDEEDTYPSSSGKEDSEYSKHDRRQDAKRLTINDETYLLPLNVYKLFETSVLAFDPLILFGCLRKGVIFTNTNEYTPTEFTLPFLYKFTNLFKTFVAYSSNIRHIQAAESIVENCNKSTIRRSVVVLEKGIGILSMKNLRRKLFPYVDYQLYIYVSLGALGSYYQDDFDVTIDASQMLISRSAVNNQLYVDLSQLINKIIDETKEYIEPTCPFDRN